MYLRADDMAAADLFSGGDRGMEFAGTFLLKNGFNYNAWPAKINPPDQLIPTRNDTDSTNSTQRARTDD